MVRKEILVVGMSHVQAILRSVGKTKDNNIKVINLTANPHIFDRKNNKINCDAFGDVDPDFIFLSLHGNFHNVIGLIENPIPFSVGDPISGQIPAGDESKNRIFIAEDMMRAFFDAELSSHTLVHIRKLIEHFTSSRFFILCMPPPSGDANHIQQFPGVFKDKLDLGVSPMSLRLKLFNIQRDLLQNSCQSLGVGFVEVPRDAVDQDGSLKRQYWNADPTHGNIDYGSLVVDQIKEIVESSQ